MLVTGDSSIAQWSIMHFSFLHLHFYFAQSLRWHWAYLHVHLCSQIAVFFNLRRGTQLHLKPPRTTEALWYEKNYDNLQKCVTFKASWGKEVVFSSEKLVVGLKWIFYLRKILFVSARVPALFLTVSLGSIGTAILHQTSHLSTAARPHQQWPTLNDSEEGKETCKKARVRNADLEESGFYSLWILFVFNLMKWIEIKPKNHHLFVMAFKFSLFKIHNTSQKLKKVLK